jgi:hypothetical protein
LVKTPSKNLNKARTNSRDEEPTKKIMVFEEAKVGLRGVKAFVA